MGPVMAHLGEELLEDGTSIDDMSSGGVSGSSLSLGSEENPDTSFVWDVLNERCMVLCQGSRLPILVDVLAVDQAMRMLKVQTVLAPPDRGRIWWLSLNHVCTVAIVSGDTLPSRLLGDQTGLVV